MMPPVTDTDVLDAPMETLGGDGLTAQPERVLVSETYDIPVAKDDTGEANPISEPRIYLRRLLISGFLTLVLGAFLYIIMEDPGHVLAERYNYVPTLTWGGLAVASSVFALVVFLVVLLIRFTFLLVLSFMNLTKDTFSKVSPDVVYHPISIILPAYNEGVLLRGTMRSLLELEYPHYEIVIVDDGSKDNTREIAREFVGIHRNVEVRLIEKTNGGKSTALNAGIKASQYDFVLCVDGDSQLSENVLYKAMQHFTDDRIGAVAGNVKVTNRKKVWTKLQALEYVEGLNMARAAQSYLKMVNIIPGPLGLFRKKAIIEAGWYSSRTFAEDCDITLKIIRNGWKIEYEPEAKSFTEAPETLNNLLKQRYRWTRGILQVIRKHTEFLFNPFKSFRITFVMWFMAFESLLWPIMNVFATFYFITIALLFDMSNYLVFWWISLTLLDIIAALYCVAAEKEELRLIWYSIYYRVFFIIIIDVCKTFAMIEEFIGLGMTWGKLERTGTAQAG